jgi:hypothetical protein
VTANRQLYLLVALIISGLVFCGCRSCSLKIQNQSGGDVNVKSSEAKQYVRIRNGGSAVLAHAFGSLEIVRDDGMKWHYPEISVSGNEKSVTTTWFFGPSSSRLILILDKDGNLYPVGRGERTNSVVPITPIHLR